MATHFFFTQLIKMKQSAAEMLNYLWKASKHPHHKHISYGNILSLMGHVQNPPEKLWAQSYLNGVLVFRPEFQRSAPSGDVGGPHNTHVLVLR